jgi:hypothetical protein
MVCQFGNFFGPFFCIFKTLSLGFWEMEDILTFGKIAS